MAGGVSVYPPASCAVGGSRCPGTYPQSEITPREITGPKAVALTVGGVTERIDLLQQPQRAAHTRQRRSREVMADVAALAGVDEVRLRARQEDPRVADLVVGILPPRGPKADRYQLRRSHLDDGKSRGHNDAPTAASRAGR